jgi:hypothetical protein
MKRLITNAVLLIAITVPAPVALLAQVPELDGTWKLSVNGQTVQVNPDGSFRVPNVSAPDQFGPGGPGTAPDFLSDDYVRVIGTSTQGGTNRYAFSEFFQVRQGQTTFINDLTFTDIPPRKPESLSILPETRVMTGALGETNQLRVIARFADGATNDVTPRTAGTSYRVSNPNIAMVTPDSALIGKARGVVYVTAVNEGASAVAQIAISPDDTLTTVVGTVVDTNGLPVARATVSAGALGMSAVTDAEGRFSIAGVPAGLGPLTVTAVLLRGTNLPLVVVSALLTPVPVRHDRRGRAGGPARVAGDGLHSRREFHDGEYLPRRGRLRRTAAAHQPDQRLSHGSIRSDEGAVGRGLQLGDHARLQFRLWGAGEDERSSGPFDDVV